MVRVIIFVFVLAVLVFVARRIYTAVLQLRMGAIPDDMDVPAVPLSPDRGWQVTREIESGVATISVEHPTEGLARTWTVYLREPGSARVLEDSMRRAGLLARDLTDT